MSGSLQADSRATTRCVLDVDGVSEGRVLGGHDDGGGEPLWRHARHPHQPAHVPISSCFGREGRLCVKRNLVSVLWSLRGVGARGAPCLSLARRLASGSSTAAILWSLWRGGRVVVSAATVSSVAATGADLAAGLCGKDGALGAGRCPGGRSCNLLAVASLLGCRRSGRGGFS